MPGYPSQAAGIEQLLDHEIGEMQKDQYPPEIVPATRTMSYVKHNPKQTTIPDDEIPF